MPNYKGINCPYCNLELEGKDNVVCPVCGTPHHRECYKQNGNCFNHAKHSEGFEFINPNVKDDILNQQQNPETSNEQQPTGFFSEFVNQIDLPSDNNEIDGISIEDWAKYIGPSSQYYLYSFVAQDKFNKKTAFTWSAAIIPIIYFIYRKVWGAAAIMLGIELICSIPSFFYLFFWQSGHTLGLSEDFVLNMGVVGSAVMLFFNLLSGVFAVWLYRKSSVKKIKKLKEISKSKSDYDIGLRKGNPSYRNIVIAFFLLMFVSTVAAYIMLALGYEPPMDLLYQYL